MSVHLRDSERLFYTDGFDADTWLGGDHVEQAIFTGRFSDVLSEAEVVEHRLESILESAILVAADHRTKRDCRCS